MSKRRLYTKSDETRVVDIPKRDSIPPEPYRTPWRRDYARLIHSSAFRRLQGKTQLFPSHESDFYRNRLTHSLEVAQIAKSIAIQLNATQSFFKPETKKIIPDIVELAGLAHDLGHPPFGHNGEKALDKLMEGDGGFEGNAQTLRILSKLEKKQTLRRDGDVPIIVNDSGEDERCGLNLSARTLAAILKYDNEIDQKRKAADGLAKGYYYTESSLVGFIKKNVAGFDKNPKDIKQFKTIECSIMDIADDIAYSTYDMEDAFKAGFLDPLNMLSAPQELIDKITEKVSKNIEEQYGDLSKDERKFNSANTRNILIQFFKDLVGKAADSVDRDNMTDEAIAAGTLMAGASISRELSENGYLRLDLTSYLVGRFVRNIEVTPNSEYPALTKVRLSLEHYKEVEVLKTFTFENLILSPHLKIAETRGQEIVEKIFEKIENSDGDLMPRDFRFLYKNLKCSKEKKRVICDFVAGMTDRYAMEFYDRLYGTTSQSVHKPI